MCSVLQAPPTPALNWSGHTAARESQLHIIQRFTLSAKCGAPHFAAMLRILIFLVTLRARALRAMCRRRADLVIENLALRQQVTALKKQRPRPPLEDVDRAFWVALRESWPACASRLVIVKSRHGGRVESGPISTILDAHLEHALPGTASPRCGDSPARPDDGTRRLGCAANPRGADEARVHRVGGDGIALHAAPACRARPSEALGRVLAQPQGRHRSDGFVHGADGVASAAVWLRRHRARPTSYRSLQRAFHPTAAWVIQQLRGTFPYDTAPRYLVFDRDSIFSPAVVEFIKAMGTKPVRISFRSPWQNGTAERWIGSCRRELLAHVVVFGERHLVRLVRSYVSLLPQGPLPLGTRKRHTGRETDHASTVTHGQGRGVAESGWPSPSIRVAGSCVAPFPVAHVAWPEAVTVLASDHQVRSRRDGGTVSRTSTLLSSSSSSGHTSPQFPRRLIMTNGFALSQSGATTPHRSQKRGETVDNESLLEVRFPV